MDSISDSPNKLIHLINNLYLLVKIQLYLLNILLNIINILQIWCMFLLQWGHIILQLLFLLLYPVVYLDYLLLEVLLVSIVSVKGKKLVICCQLVSHLYKLIVMSAYFAIQLLSRCLVLVFCHRYAQKLIYVSEFLV